MLFAGASFVLFLACVGGWIAYRYLALGWLPALVAFSFAGWFLEAFPFQHLYRTIDPWLLFGLYPPVVAGHYVLIAVSAYLLVRRRVEALPRWDHPLKWPLAVAAPAALPSLLALLAT